VAASRTMLPFAGNDVSLSFLPLSHIFGRMSDHYLMFSVGASIAYAEHLDALGAGFTEVRPSFVFSVPRVFEKVHPGVLDRAMHGSALTRRIFVWARGVAERWTE